MNPSTSRSEDRLMLHIQCDQCKTWNVTQNLNDPDSALSCDCCTQDHSHAEAANNGDPCRPVTITMLPGTVQMQSAAGV